MWRRNLPLCMMTCNCCRHVMSHKFKHQNTHKKVLPEKLLSFFLSYYIVLKITTAELVKFLFIHSFFSFKQTKNNKLDFRHKHFLLTIYYLMSLTYLMENGIYQSIEKNGQKTTEISIDG